MKSKEVTIQMKPTPSRLLRYSVFLGNLPNEISDFLFVFDLGSDRDVCTILSGVE